MYTYDRHRQKIDCALLRRFNLVYLSVKLIAFCLATLLVIWLRAKPYSALFYALASVGYFCLFIIMMFVNREAYNPAGKAIAYILAVAPAGVLLAHVPNALVILLGIVIMIAIFSLINLLAPQFSLYATRVAAVGLIIHVAYIILVIGMDWSTLDLTVGNVIFCIAMALFIVTFAIIWEHVSYGVITDENAARAAGPWNFFLDMLPEGMVDG